MNDTSGGYHWGCFATSSHVKSEILRRNPKNLVNIPVQESHQLKCVPERIEDFELAFGTFELENKHVTDKIRNSDIVIINGEGTIHGFNNGPRGLLYICYIATRFYHKKVFLVNHSCFPESTTANVVNFYKTCYKCCDYIAVRENASHKLLTEWGIKADLAFDSLPLKVREIYDDISPHGNDGKYICVSGGVNFRLSKARYIARYLNFYFEGHEIVFLTGAADPCMDDGDKFVYEEMKKYIPGMKLVYAETFEKWLSVIKSSWFLLSGRFHYTVAKMCFSQRVIALESNTPKIFHALRMFRLPKTVAYKGPLFGLAYRLLLARLGIWAHDGFLDKMCLLAENNYKWEQSCE